MAELHLWVFAGDAVLVAVVTIGAAVQIVDAVHGLGLVGALVVVVGDAVGVVA